ncbi:MAG: prenyltransferase/squalene oxidase repeat-containing protein, partial [Planctomycetota bacterium]
RVELQPGTNHLLCEISQAGGAWNFQLLHSRARVDLHRRTVQKRINAAIDSGVDWLLRSQQLDGSWSYKIHEYVGGQTALSLYTLIKSGVGPEHPSVRRGLAFLRVSPSVSVYDTSCRMMLLGAIADAEAREELEVHLEQLLDWQSGGFAYPEVPTSVADLSNTQYAALGLTAAAAAAGNVPQKSWKALAGYVLDCGNDDGGFCYRPGMASTGAMTAAGVATSALCLQALGSEDRRVQRTAEKLREGIAGGLQWLGENLRLDLNPEPAAENYGNDRWRNYYLYGLERVGAVTGTKRLNHRDWYWSGANRLVQDQKDVGNWASAYGEDLPNTCFALLFLQKATQTLTGRSERPSKSSLGDDDSERAASLRGSRKDGELTLWISSFGTKSLEEYERENERGRGLRVKQVEYFDRFGEEERSAALAEGDPTRPSETERWPVRLRLIEPGLHVLFARLTLDDDTLLETQELRVQADTVLEPWMIPYAESRGDDPIASVRKKFERSSVTKPYPAKHAFDGFQATSWLCASNDSEREIELQLSKAVKTKRLLFTVAVPKPTTPDWCGRPTVIELGWNGKRDPVRIELDPDPMQKTTYEFERALPIR